MNNSKTFICDADSSEAQTSSIWINKRENNTIVDQKKLQKAEAKLKAKQGKRTQDTEPINEIRGRWGEVLLLDLQ